MDPKFNIIDRCEIIPRTNTGESIQNEMAQLDLPLLNMKKSSFINSGGMHCESKRTSLANEKLPELSITFSLEHPHSPCPKFMECNNSPFEPATLPPFSVFEFPQNVQIMPADSPSLSPKIKTPIPKEDSAMKTNLEESIKQDVEFVPIKKIKKAGRKSAFSPEEDKILLQLVKIHGAANWLKISDEMPQFNRKQLRERYVNYLKKSFRLSDFTPEEDAKILNYVKTLGHSWQKIAEYLPGRTAIMIKNRFTKKLQTRKRKNKLVAANSACTEKQEISPPNEGNACNIFANAATQLHHIGASL